MFCKLSRTPNTFNSQITRIITTTALSMLLIVLCIGIYVFTNQRITPTTRMTIKIVKIGISLIFKLVLELESTKIISLAAKSIT